MRKHGLRAEWAAIWFAVGVLVSAGASWAEPLSPQEAARYADLDARALQTFTNIDLANYLQLRNKLLTGDPRRPTLAEEIGRYALKAIGQQYRFPALQFELAGSDCVTFVERSLALACSGDWDSYYRVATRLRYRDGIPDITHKNHFTLADWLPNNAWLLAEVTDHLGVVPATFEEAMFPRRTLALLYGLEADAQPVPGNDIQLGVFRNETNAAAKLRSLHEAGLTNAIIEPQLRNGETLWIVRARYASYMEAVAALPRVRQVQSDAQLAPAALAAAKAALIAAAPEVQVTSYSHIPRGSVPAVLDYLRSGDICLIISRHLDRTGRWPWQSCDHMGVIARTPEGAVTIVHSIPPAVRQDELGEFVRHRRRIVGLKIVRLRDLPIARIAGELARTAAAVHVPGPASQDTQNQAFRERQPPVQTGSIFRWNPYQPSLIPIIRPQESQP